MDASGKPSRLSLMGVLALAAVLILTLHGQSAPAAGDVAPKYRALLVSGDNEEGSVLDVKHFEEVLKGGTNWAAPNVVETMFAPTPSLRALLTAIPSIGAE